MTGFETARCPNCGTVCTDRYVMGTDEFAEFDCNNTNCRCQVFRTDTPDDVS